MFHASWTEWKNLFSLEIFCRSAKLQVDGLAGSYGSQRLTIYSMKPELGPPDLETIDFPPDDESWSREWQEFADAVHGADGRPLSGDLESAAYGWQCVEAAYARTADDGRCRAARSAWPPQIVVLGGGLGSRMEAVADGRPKSLIPILGEPFVHHQLRLLASQGFRDVVYVIGFRGEQIRRAVGDGSEFGLAVSYVDEGDQLRGTGGALRFAHDTWSLDDVFGVVYGDSYLPVDFSPVRGRIRFIGSPGADDGSSKRRSLGQEQRRVRGRASDRLRQADSTFEMRRCDGSTTAFRSFDVTSWSRSPNEAVLSAISATSSTSSACEGTSPASRSTRRFFEVGSPEGVTALESYLESATLVRTVASERLDVAYDRADGERPRSLLRGSPSPRAVTPTTPRELRRRASRSSCSTTTRRRARASRLSSRRSRIRACGCSSSSTESASRRLSTADRRDARRARLPRELGSLRHRPTTSSEMELFFAAHPRAGAATGKILRYRPRAGRGDADPRHDRARDRTGSRRVGPWGEPRGRRTVRAEEQVFGVSGAALVARREALESVKVGGEYLDESFFMYKEDVDLSWRLRLAGWECWYVPRARVPRPHELGRRVAGTSRVSARFTRNERAKPRHVRVHSMKNQWLMLVKNEDASNLVRHLPLSSAERALVLGYNTLFAPRVTAVGSARIRRCFPAIAREPPRDQVEADRRTRRHSEWFVAGASQPVSFAEPDRTPTCRPRVASPHRSRPAAPRAPSPPRRRR